MVPGTLPSSVEGPVILVVNKADGDEEVGKFPKCLSFIHLNVIGFQKTSDTINREF